MDLPKLIEQFGSEDRCRAYLEELRWPNGVVCPRCECESVSKIESRSQWECNSCRYQFSVTAGTIFHDSHLPLWKWFLAVYLIGESKKGISAKQLQRTLGVSYKTAWYLAHRIRNAMGEDEQPLLRGIVEIDETLVGGHRPGAGRGWSRDKTVVVGAIQRDGEIRLKVAKARSRKCIEEFIEEHVDDETRIFTDSFRGYDSIPDERHQAVNHKAGEWRRGDAHTNSIEGVWSLFKRSIVGSYHKISVKHMPAYLDEMEFRFNNRENKFLFRDTLMVMLLGDALPYADLVS